MPTVCSANPPFTTTKQGGFSPRGSDLTRSLSHRPSPGGLAAAANRQCPLRVGERRRAANGTRRPGTAILTTSCTRARKRIRDRAAAPRTEGVMSIRATVAEQRGSYPGDELCAKPRIVTTRGIEVQAAAEQIWPWLVQLGQHRGGFYSYTWIENLMGCRMRNASRVHPEWQSLDVGDSIPMHPRLPPLRVAALEPDRHLVLASTTGLQWTWCFLLRPVSTGTRLLVRTRVSWTPHWGSPLFRLVMGPGHWLMERKMLHGIRTRAERTTPSP